MPPSRCRRGPRIARTGGGGSSERRPRADMRGQLNGLSEAVRALYDAFANCSRRAEIEFDACDHCVSPEEARALARTPLHYIDAQVLSAFILNASSETWGTAGHRARYYLPRISELVATGEFNRNDL